MSNSIFPTLAGLKWDSTRTPSFNTLVHRSASGREIRMALMLYPLWTFSLSYEVLRIGGGFSELQTLSSFFMARYGQYDSFLYTDPTDNSVTDQLIGTGDGVTTTFQLVRTWGSFVEPVMNGNVLTNIKVNGLAKTVGTDYTVDASGVVTFAVAPALALPITWTGSYFYRCRFTHDDAEFTNMMQNLWSAKKMEFVGGLGNKV